MARKYKVHSMCSFQCVKITHEATWEAYVAIAATEDTLYFVKNGNCDRSSGSYNPYFEPENAMVKPKSSASGFSWHPQL